MASMKAIPPMQKSERDNTFRRLLWYLTRQKGLLTVVVICAIISNGFIAVAPLLLGQGTNVLFAGLLSEILLRMGYKPGTSKAAIIASLNANGKGSLAAMAAKMDINLSQAMNWRLFGLILLGVTGCYIASFLIRFLQNAILTKIVVDMISDFRTKIEEKINHLPLSFFDRVPRGQVMSTTTNDVDNITGVLQQMLGDAFWAFFSFLATVIIMIIVAPWWMTLISLLIVPMIILTARVVVRRAKPHFADQWNATGELNATVEEMFTGHQVVRAYGMQSEAKDDFDVKNRKFYRASYISQALSALIQPTSGFFGNLIFVIVVIVGSAQVLAGHMTLGVFQAFAQYTRQLSQPVSQIASMTTQMQSALASCTRIFKFLDVDVEQPDADNPLQLGAAPEDDSAARKVRGHVRFDHVKFSYDPDNPLIEDLSFEAKPGQTIAIVGPTGAGKTTLVNLLMRFYEIQGGTITIGGVDTSKVTRHDLRSHFGMVLQDAWLFNGTIRENLEYGLDEGKHLSDEELIAGAKATHVDEFVSRLPQGYDTEIDFDSSTLSQGECQLLTICRAFLSQPDILILDEATSSVDTRTEMLVQQAMSTLREGRTSFVIAHRLSTIRDADLILVVNHGSIVEQGTQDELLAKGGAYAKLYNSQFAGAAQ